ncbi:uncharacterized protein LOC129750145 isoform X1 [Uranotaenia lowii]|uniref:uncharacterized protein LOC129750145 isoform X1 n=1 Tax=Uranotaenia lowii TaxID=190385 RepID=UPI002479F3CB|nr:uncharacterized protein LOC129750145 isoform X1 [Uranotaenia lowii]XP_055601362.1 uncharacterized protein LOC129750145 isoform X1 [Uranotaenia lowii]
MKVSYKLSHFLNLYFIFATTTTCTSLSSGSDLGEQNLAKLLPPPTTALHGKSAKAQLGSPAAPFNLGGSLPFAGARDKSQQILKQEHSSGGDGSSGKFYAHPKPVNHHFSTSDTLLEKPTKWSSGGLLSDSAGNRNLPHLTGFGVEFDERRRLLPISESKDPEKLSKLKQKLESVTDDDDNNESFQIDEPSPSILSGRHPVEELTNQEIKGARNNGKSFELDSSSASVEKGQLKISGDSEGEENDDYDYGEGEGSRGESSGGQSTPDDAATESDNYGADKSINPAAMDNLFDKTSSFGVFGRGQLPRKGNTATGSHLDPEEDSDEDEDIYGEEDEEEEQEEEGGDLLPVDGAFESFGKPGEQSGVSRGGDSGLPYFLVEPQSTHVLRNRPAILKCKAANALQVHFKCSGSHKPPPSTEESHVDPHTGVHFQEVTATVSRDLVFEYFGKSPFKCECHAWSPRGKTVSQPASIVVAYLKKSFGHSPHPQLSTAGGAGKLRAELGQKVEIPCEPPKGYPKPQITWLKNNFTFNPSAPGITQLTNVAHQGTGTIVISAVKLQDIGNYTCVAENIAGKRIAEPIELIVYVNGGWSQWSAWLECRCPGKSAQGRKRTRTCSDPIPLYGGAPCVGPNQQKTADCVTCPEDTQIITPNGFEDNTFVRRWSSWSSWSTCTAKCVQVRRRVCRTHQNVEYFDKALIKHHQQLAALMDPSGAAGDLDSDAGFGCHGKDTQSIVCRGNECRIDDTASDWIFYLGLGFIVTLCVTFLVFLLHMRHRQKIPSFSIPRRTADEHTYAHEFQKKLTHSSNAPDINIRVNNYEYSNGSTMEAPKLPSQNVPLLLSRSISTEHHYDEPQFAASYSTPIDSKSHENANLYHQQKLLQQQHLQSTVQYKSHVLIPNGTVASVTASTASTGRASPSTINQATKTASLKKGHLHNHHQQQQQQLTLLSQTSQQLVGPYRSAESLNTNSNSNSSNSTYAVATTDSVDTSTGSNSTSGDLLYKSNSMRQVVTSDGGWLELEHLQTSLSIPEGALPDNLKINVFLAVMYDCKDTILVENQITHISPTIVCGPAKSSFSKPLIIKVPHCAEDISNWKISLFYKEEVTNCWKKIASSENDVPSPQAYIQLDLKNAYIMTRRLGKYILGGENLMPEVSVMKRLKIYMFGPSRKPEMDFNIRVYILEDYPSALEHCSLIENRMGYFMIGQSSAFHFMNNKENLLLRINCSGGWIAKPDSGIQQIPFNHVWKNMSILHCDFMLQKLVDEIPCLRVELSAEQENGAKVLITAVAFS